MTGTVAKWDPDLDTGLEEFGIEDAVIPRISIIHKEGRFKDSLSNQEFDKINVIILGLVKQRVLWHPTVDDDDWPMCRSQDHNTGFPNLSDEQPKDKRFPWDKSGFDPTDYPADDEGRIRLPCGSCQLKEWGSHPDGKKPYCAEQFTLPILYDPEEDGTWVPAILTFQKTALKSLKAYLSSFARAKNAAYTAVTEIGLDMQKKGSNEYSTPNFKKIGNTDEENWREYATNFRQMADFLRADPGSRDEEEAGTSSDNTARPPADSKTEVVEDGADSDVVDAEVVEDSAPPADADKTPPASTSDSTDDDDDDDGLPF
jgi:hypothetical protein